MSIYELKFSQTEKTDAILLVDGQKLHVNKALLSYHSDYFKTLFNGEFKEKSMLEIPIKDDDCAEFAALLSLVQDNPSDLYYNWPMLERLLKLAERFSMPAAKRHVELFIGQTYIDKLEKLKLADKYDLEVLLDHALKLYNERGDYRVMKGHINLFSDKTKVAIFDHFFYTFDDYL